MMNHFGTGMSLMFFMAMGMQEASRVGWAGLVYYIRTHKCMALYRQIG